MKLSIIVPVYNEKDTIEEILKKLDKLPIDKEILVVDDGSNDGSRQLISNLKSQISNIKIIFHEKNLGKGGAIQTGLKNSSGDVICIQDADLEYDCNEIPKLFDKFKDNSIDAVFGSRFLKANPNIYKRFLLGNKFLTFLTNLLHGTHYTDTYTCYKLIKKDVFSKLKIVSFRYEMEAEISIKLKKMNFKVVEEPISYAPRTLAQGKKIGWKDAVRGVWTIIKLRF
ncbi:MAG: glycosyltransferase family 2 protein [Elusimicrobia bacterium]|nr:glycosyltransferase family 2 protein [Elusimicrobiota bacterium]